MLPLAAPSVIISLKKTKSEFGTVNSNGQEQEYEWDSHFLCRSKNMYELGNSVREVNVESTLEVDLQVTSRLKRKKM